MTIKKLFLTLVGILSVILGFIGIFLPLLPTVPFILLASACFMRSSPRFHAWLVNNKTFGPILDNWHKHKAIDKKIKKRAYWVFAFSFCTSLWLSPTWHGDLVICLVFIVLVTCFSRIPVMENGTYQELKNQDN